MAKVAITKSKMDSLANSIATKSGVPVTMTVDEMKDAVDGIVVPSGTMSVAENGTYDIAAFAQMIVDVASGVDGDDLAYGVTVALVGSALVGYAVAGKE